MSTILYWLPWVLQFGLFLYFGVKWIMSRQKLIQELPFGPSVIRVLYEVIFHDFRTLLNQSKSQFGNIFSLFSRWIHPVIVVGDLSTIDLMTNTRGFLFTGRPKFATLRSTTLSEGGIFGSEGDDWRSKACQLHRCLTDIENLNYCDEKTTGIIIGKYENKHVHLRKIANELAVVSLYKLCFGYQLEIEQIEKLAKAIDCIIDTEQRLLNYILPNSVAWFLLKLNYSYRKSVDYFETHLIKTAREDSCQLPCLISSFQKFHPEQTPHLVALFVADILLIGVAASSSIIASSFDKLSTNFESQKRWLNETQFQESFIKEITRLYPPFPLGLPRCTLSDTRMLGYIVPRSAIILMDLAGVMIEFPDHPAKFLPDRFLPSNDNIQTHTSIAFGRGKRICSFDKWTGNYLISVVQNILLQYEISQVSNKQSVFFGFFKKRSNSNKQCTSQITTTKSLMGLVYKSRDCNILLNRRSLNLSSS